MNDGQGKENITTPGVLALKRLLQKYLKRIVSALPKLEAAESRSEVELKSLVNLLEQREAAARVDRLTVPIMSSFPDLQAKVMVKLSMKIHNKVDALKEEISLMKELHATAQKARTEAVELQDRYRDQIHRKALALGTPTVPPLAVMLDWLDVVETQLREQYFSRLHYLDDVAQQETIMSENLLLLWAEDMPKLFNVMKDCQEQTQFFLQEKL